jgi:uncharacterized phage infection (PIP) family protein YhgE
VRVAQEDARPVDGAAADEVELIDTTADPQFARIDELAGQLDEAAGRAAEARTAAEAEGAAAETRDALASAESDAKEVRDKLLAEMNKFIQEAKRRENALVATKKARNGERTAAVSELGIKIGEGASESTIDAVQERVDRLDAELAELTAQIAGAKE